MPECDLRAAIDDGVTTALKGYHQKLQDAWHTPNGSPKATPKLSANASASDTARASTDTTPNGSTLHEEERKKGRDQKQDQDPGLAAGIAPCGNVEKSQGPHRRPLESPRPTVLARLVVDLLEQHADDTEPYNQADIKEDLKRACARLGLAYHADAVRKALDAAEAQWRRGAKQSA